MLEKDTTYSKLRTEKMLERHPSLVDSYRAILLDWLSEVSHECKFHRETYHLALDFIDRYLAATSNIGKFQLQLIGTTCLFLAAKFEEIRPPTVVEFAELTDGACRPEEIIENEVVVLSALNWEITPMTPNNWLNIYMQILMNLDKEEQQGLDDSATAHPTQRNCPVADENSGNHEFRLAATKNDAFILPQNNGILRYSHKRIAGVVDLAILHIESLRFSNSILTAAALYHFTDEQTVHQCTGYKYQELAECVHWLKPFVDTIKEIKEPIFMASHKDETHATQMHTHIATVSLLERVTTKMETRRQSLKRKACSLDEEVISDSEADSILASSPLKAQSTVLLTPPSSTRKSRRLR